MNSPENRLKLVLDDPSLSPYNGALSARRDRFFATVSGFEATGGLLGSVSQGHRYYGVTAGDRDGIEGIWVREWAPGATSLSVVGEFNFWNPDANRMTRDEYGVWSHFFPYNSGQDFRHGSKMKIHVESALGNQDRIPVYAKRAVQDDTTKDFMAQVWLPEPYVFQNASPKLDHGLRIYEVHIGMSLEEGRVATFNEFAEQILPRVASLGYNAIQIMAVAEHPYYASFGYHVSSLFAVSSRFGTPEDLKRLIDEAHALGIVVLLDLVHSHSVKNTNEGMNLFDGTDYQYFHTGGKGMHPAWDSMLFDYGKFEVQRLLLSNVRYWLEEFRFDGMRMDGVTSMLYLDHGLARTFSSYDDYFGENVDPEAVCYLQIANALAHEINPEAITIAEDVSGMPGLARPAEEGGIGFDYRLNMGVPDYWIKLVKETADERWDLGAIYSTMLNRRHSEKHVGYVESHDQALVGDQTLAFRMMGAEMYHSMNAPNSNPVTERGVALHKMIRLLTFSLAGEGYLTFIGNEFAHPEWIDFPREGNNYSYHFARRQWSLADNPFLAYGKLLDFDREMLSLDTTFDLLRSSLIELLMLHEDSRQLIYRHGPLVFAFNFHPTESYPALRIPVPDFEDYFTVLDTDSLRFSGHGRNIATLVQYPIQKVERYGRPQSVEIYLPSRSAQVLAPSSYLK